MTSHVDIEACLGTVKGGSVLRERNFRILYDRVKEILIEESNVQPVSAPVTISGDIKWSVQRLA
jgi:hypothetical protein